MSINHKCPVCTKPCDSSATQCTHCGLHDAKGLCRNLLSEKDAQTWITETLAPARAKYQVRVEEQARSLSFDIGSNIKFDKYDWKVIDTNADSILLLMQYALPAHTGIPYCENSRGSDTNWADCTIRNWLNNDFLNTFNIREQNSIQETSTTDLYGNPLFGVTTEKETRDKIFILSLSEVVQYLGYSGQLRSIEGLKERENSQIPCVIDDSYNRIRRYKCQDTYTWWWLRTPGENHEKATYVDTDGVIYLNGSYVYEDGSRNTLEIRPAVRPTIHVTRKYFVYQPLSESEWIE